MGKVVYSILSYKSHPVSFFHPNISYILKGKPYSLLVGLAFSNINNDLRLIVQKTPEKNINY